MNIILLLKEAVKIKIIRPIDFYFAQFISKNNTVIMLIAACVSYESTNGHIFLTIEYFRKMNFFSSTNITFNKKILANLPKKINWMEELIKHTSVSNGLKSTPLVLLKDRVYLYKMWKAEATIIQHLYKKNTQNKINYKKCSQILDNLFDNKKAKNMQKVAVALTLINNITFIMGGPGTGKTTTILKIIIALIKNSTKMIKIQLSAPTGKATIRLNEIINNNIFDVYLSKKEKTFLPSNAVTIHQLLGIQKISQKSFFNQHQLLDIDVLIIDETSMIDILCIQKILNAVPKNTKLIFIGDHNQLCPIESGSILRNIFFYANQKYSNQTISILQKITKYRSLQKSYTKKHTHCISNNICLLNKNYRFYTNSGIYILSNAILNKKQKIIQQLFNNKIKNIFFYETNSIKEYQNMIEKITLNYRSFWEKIYKKANVQEIIETFQQHQVLCTLHNGIFGVKMLNTKLEENMYKKNIIKYVNINGQIWYEGKPIMITNNNKHLDLFNGDIGIFNINHKSCCQVSFLRERNIVKNIPVNILRKYQTAWAITVHKAQGSEFINTSLILPNIDSSLLNEDILYTGVTRSRNILNIFANKNIFMKTALKTTAIKDTCIEKIDE